MRILVVCQRYWPEQFQITTICEELVQRGHEVTVLCGLPNVGASSDGKGRVLKSYRYGKNRLQNHNGVHIHRSFEIGRRSGVIWRACNYYSFWNSAKHNVKRLTESFDVVFAYQLSPAMMAIPAVEYSKKTGVPVFIYCCDLWPESMKAMLGNKLPSLINHYGKICRDMYKYADKIGIQSPEFVNYFESEHGIDRKKLVYFPHFSTDVSDGEYGISFDEHNETNLIFLGNMGTVQGIDWMIDAMAELNDVDKLNLHFVGDGSVLSVARDQVTKLGLSDRIYFHGRRPIKEMPYWYSIADICLLGLDDSSAVGLTIPSKLQGYMAAGRPVIGAVNGGARFVIEDSDCGIAVKPGDIQALANAIRNLAEDKQIRLRYGKNARSYYEQHFTKQAFIDSLEVELEKLVKGINA